MAMIIEVKTTEPLENVHIYRLLPWLSITGHSVISVIMNKGVLTVVKGPLQNSWIQVVIHDFQPVQKISSKSVQNLSDFTVTKKKKKKTTN